jgi:hypothetical protein
MKMSAKAKDEAVDHVLRVTVGSPSRRTIFSLPHRILTILLRRGYLKHHDSAESLMQGREYNIAIKESAKKLPVFLAGTARGLGLSDEQASTSSLTMYIKPRTQWLGYEDDCAFYSWRRKFGTQIDRKFGLEKTRIAMSHCPMSRI